MAKIRFLNGNTLKIIAAISMLIDHIGYMFFPTSYLLRIIGRLAFPIFAYMIAEGCKHTKNKLKYFLTIFLLATAFQVVYYIFTKEMYFNILFTFSFAILIIYALQFFKNNLINNNAPLKTLISGLLLISIIIAVFIVNIVFEIDYGFMGCMLPVFASLFHFNNDNSIFSSSNIHNLSIAMFSLGLILLSLYFDSVIQLFSLLTIPLLMLYSGERGKYNMKYFFYIFYPAHLVILYVIRLLI